MGIRFPFNVLITYNLYIFNFAIWLFIAVSNKSLFNFLNFNFSKLGVRLVKIEQYIEGLLSVKLLFVSPLSTCEQLV